jgi:Flp pilus assembly protein TadG
MVANLIASLAAFRRDRSANVALIFGLSILPVIGLVGAGVDYSIANKVHAKMQAAADSASVGSIAKNSAGYKAAVAMNGNKPIPEGVADATNIFNGVIKNDTGFKTPTLDITVKREGTQILSTVKYTTTVNTRIMGILGKSTMTIAGISSAATSLPTYIDFYLLLDNTPSMGVGATTADINTMVANTPDKCAFACHDLSDPNNYYKKAKNLNVKMRIDVVRQATQQLMDYATSVEQVSDQFRAAIYTFGEDATQPGLKAVQSLTNNLGTAKTSANKIDLMRVPYQNYKGDTITDFHDIFGDLNTTIPASGAGTSTGASLKYLFIVSDGVNDRALGSPLCSKLTTVSTDPETGVPYLRCQEPLPASLCTTLKNKGVKIAVLYTTYLPLPTNAWYNTWVGPWQSQIATNMKACASPDLYFEVSPSQGIPEAMIALFQKAMKTARITN